MKDHVSTGEILDIQQRNTAEEIYPITLMGKWMNRYQEGGLDRSTNDRYAAKRIRREGSRPIDNSYIQGEVKVG
jgi:hypothetical protein